MKLRPGEQIAKYQLLKRLGRGGNGEVWRAAGPDASEVALKVLTRGGREAQDRFRREVDLQRGELAGLPGLLPVLDGSGLGTQPWLTMPVATPIAEALAEASLDDVLGAVADIAAVLGRLHALGYAHRDVKPGNLYRHDGQWVVGDLGLVDLPEPTPLTVGRRALGPRWFLAPEMLSDPAEAISGPADVYSLAKTLWVLMVGAAFPPPGTHVREVAALRASSFVQHPRIAFLDRLMERSTAHEPRDRPNAEEFSRELRLILDGSKMTDGADGPDLGLLREELRLASETSRRGDASRQDRTTAGRDLADGLVQAGTTTSEAFLRAEAPLMTPTFGDNDTILQRAQSWSVRNPEARFGRCIACRLSYETGLIGPRRIDEILLWSGFGVITTAEGVAVIIAAHVIGQSVVWTDSRLVPLGSMEAEQAVNELAAGLRDSVAEALDAFLRAYQRATGQT